jgi:hypothetical protein
VITNYTTEPIVEERLSKNVTVYTKRGEVRNPTESQPTTPQLDKQKFILDP